MNLCVGSSTILPKRYRARCDLLRSGYEGLGLTIARWAGQPLQSIGTALHLPAAWSAGLDRGADAAREPAVDRIECSRDGREPA